jgi:hypothetical protein
MKVYIGIDNGITGTIGIIAGDIVRFMKTPTKSELSYTREKQNITRIDFDSLIAIFNEYKDDEVSVLIERPMITPLRFKATVSASRSLEATLIAIEQCKLRYAYIDSRKWQGMLLPSGLEKEELKSASLDIAKRMFPKLDFKGIKDGDGILIAEYLRKTEQ